jgi:hypothetical protein
MEEKSAAVTRHVAVERFGRQDWFAAAVLFIASLAIRVPFRSHLIFR